MPIRLDPATFAKAVLVESSDIPDDMTLAQWREQRRAHARPARRRRRVVRIRRRRRAR